MPTQDQTTNYIDLADLRKSIDLLDSSFMLLLSERARLISKIGMVKKQHGVDFTRSDSRKRDLKNLVKTAIERKLRESFITELYEYMYVEALNIIKNLDKNSIPITPPDNHPATQEHRLSDLRKSMYNLDMSICHILAERFRVVLKVGLYKKAHDIQPLADNRWQQLLSNKLEVAASLNISKNFIQDIFNLIHQEALFLQSKICDK